MIFETNYNKYKIIETNDIYDFYDFKTMKYLGTFTSLTKGQEYFILIDNIKNLENKIEFKSLIKQYKFQLSQLLNS